MRTEKWVKKDEGTLEGSASRTKYLFPPRPLSADHTHMQSTAIECPLFLIMVRSVWVMSVHVISLTGHDMHSMPLFRQVASSQPLLLCRKVKPSLVFIIIRFFKSDSLSDGVLSISFYCMLDALRVTSKNNSHR